MPQSRPLTAFLSCLALGLCVGAGAAPSGWTKSGASEVSFHARGTGGFKLKGSTDELEISDDGSVLTVTVPLQKLATGIALRDRHMKEKYLEVEKYPTTSLAVSLASLTIPQGAGALRGEARGRYTLRDVTKEVPFTYQGKCDASGRCQIKGEIKLKMTEYGVKVPSYLGITVKPDVVVHANFTMKRN